jgi:uncharacterized protein involved in exopolysaccharide biosynthesis
MRHSWIQSELTELRDKLHNAELKAAVADTKMQESEKQNHRLEQEIKEMKDKHNKIK